MNLNKNPVSKNRRDGSDGLDSNQRVTAYETVEKPLLDPAISSSTSSSTVSSTTRCFGYRLSISVSNLTNLVLKLLVMPTKAPANVNSKPAAEITDGSITARGGINSDATKRKHPTTDNPTAQ